MSIKYLKNYKKCIKQAEKTLDIIFEIMHSSYQEFQNSDEIDCAIIDKLTKLCTAQAKLSEQFFEMMDRYNEMTEARSASKGNDEQDKDFDDEILSRYIEARMKDSKRVEIKRARHRMRPMGPMFGG